MDIEYQYIKDIERLIPRPDIALAVLSLAHDSGGSIPVLAQKIEQDPSLTANMLKMANSAYFGHMRKVNSIKEIIVRLGLETIRMLAISSASVGLLQTPQDAYGLEPKALWHHSYATAILTSILGKYAGVEDQASLFTAGLLHDIGKIILNRPLQTEALHAGFETGGSSLQQERTLLYTDHARVGMALLENWGVPDKIVMPVGMHHDRDSMKSERLGCKIIYLANWLTNQYDLVGVNQREQLEFDKEIYLDQQSELPEVPNFAVNLEQVFEEFVRQYSDATILVL